MRQALAHSLLLEKLCRQYLLARAAGTPRLLTPDQMAAAQAAVPDLRAANDTRTVVQNFPDMNIVWRRANRLFQD